jgi:hypothetical protein
VIVARNSKFARCEHGFYAACCTESDCEHYDGKGQGAGPESTFFVWCISCHSATPRNEAVQASRKCKTEFKCKICANCIECRANRRPKDSRFCQECFDKLTAPRPCVVCGELLYCPKPIKKHLTNHRKRNKHRQCSINIARETVIRVHYLPAAE